MQSVTNFAAIQRAAHDLADFLVQQRFAAGDHHHGRAAFVDRLHAVFIRQALVQDLVGIVDLAAARAGEIAAKQRLEHQDQGIAFPSEQMLLEDIGADARPLNDRDSHCRSCRVGASAPLNCPFYTRTFRLNPPFVASKNRRSLNWIDEIPAKTVPFP